MAFDLDAVAAEVDEAEPFRFTFGGDSYELPPRIDIRAIALLTKGEVGDALKVLLGPDQYERLLASPAVFNDTRFAALVEAYAQHQSVSTGELSASTSSSASTAEQ
jgi:hypothetical protein